MTAGFFSAAGYTETGGLQEFLRKLRPDVDWVRCFPAVDKPAPKIGRRAPAPRAGEAGTTGKRLVNAMLERLREHYAGDRCPFDFVLLVDDLDCRLGDEDGALAGWTREVSARVRDAAERELILYVLAASPEIEAWMLADWEEGFGREYRGIGVPLRRHVQDCLLGPIELGWDSVEDYGGRRIGAGCERKLSDDLRDAVRAGGRCSRCSPAGETQPTGVMAGLDYNKRHNGAAMLKRVRPERVRESCVRYFAPAYRDLLAATPSVR